LAQPIAFILMVAFGALAARAYRADRYKEQANALTAIFYKPLYLTQTAA